MNIQEVCVEAHEMKTDLDGEMSRCTNPGCKFAVPLRIAFTWDLERIAALMEAHPCPSDSAPCCGNNDEEAN